MFRTVSDFVERLRVRLRSQLIQNVLANYLAVAWTGGLSILLIPWYLRLLGAHEWGIVAVCMALQAIFGLLDAGLSQIMPRDIAKVAMDKSQVARVFRLFFRAYAVVALAGFVLGQLAVPLLLQHWLNLDPSQRDAVELPLRLVFFQLAFQFANGAHIGYWNGVQSQTRASLRQCMFATLRHAAALSLLSYWRPEAWVYISSFAIVAFFEWLLNYLAIRVNMLSDAEVSSDDVRRLLREIGFLIVSVMVGMAATQMDRVILVRYVDLATFGRYVLVLNLGLAFMQFQYPLMRAFLPKMVASEGTSRRDGVGSLWLMVLLFCILPCMCAAVLAPWLLQIWLHDPIIVSQCTLPLRLILLAVAINAIYHLLYQRLLVRGHVAVIFYINAASVAVVSAFLLAASPIYGIAAGGGAWVVLGVVQLIGGAWFLRAGARVKSVVH